MPTTAGKRIRSRCPPRWTVWRSARNIDLVKEQQTIVGRLYDLIQEHLDSQVYDVSERQFAYRVGVSPTTIGNWREPKKLIAKEHLVAIAHVTRVPYQRVLQALLEDIGYWDEHIDVDKEGLTKVRGPEPNLAEVTRLQAAADYQERQTKAARQDPKP